MVTFLKGRRRNDDAGALHHEALLLGEHRLEEVSVVGVEVGLGHGRARWVVRGS